MILGAAAREAGAVCDQIPTSTPGVAYVCEDGDAAPVRVRAFHVTDADIDYLATHFAPHQPSAGTSGNGSAHQCRAPPVTLRLQLRSRRRRFRSCRAFRLASIP